MLRYVGFLLMFCLLKTTCPVNAQQVNGHWFGIGMLQTTREYNQYLSELVLSQKGRQVNGYLNYYFKDSLVKVSVNGSFDELTRKLTLKPFPVIYYLSPNARNSIDCSLSGRFTLITSKTGSVLSGTLFGDDDHKYTVPEIIIRLTKSDDTANLVMSNAELPEPIIDTTNKQPAVNQVTAASPAPETVLFNQRKKNITKEIEVTGAAVKIELYDNGEIDYDSASLFLNDKLILAKSMLTHKAIRLSIELDQSRDYNDISMYADNLGMIPPNTAALILYDGKTRYEVIMTSDLGKSATIRLRRKRQPVNNR